MKGIRTVKRYFRDAAKSLVRKFSLSLASISCITITLIVVALSIVISYNVEEIASKIKQDVTMIVFIDNGATEDEVKQIGEEIKKISNVEEVTFKSKEESASELAESDSTFNTVTQEWTDETNRLLDSYMIKVKDIEKIHDTANKIEKMDKIDTINYGEDMINQILPVFEVIDKVCIGAVIALIVVTAFLIANTIKLAIFARKTEIEIMRLVGASNISIKIPFIIEGLFLGGIGSIIPIIVTIYGYTTLYDYFGGMLFSSNLAQIISPVPFVYIISVILLIIGMLVGMFGSYRAVKKYLKI